MSDPDITSVNSHILTHMLGGSCQWRKLQWWSLQSRHLFLQTKVKVSSSNSEASYIYILTGVCSTGRWLPGVTTAVDGLPIAVVGLVFVAVLATIVATGWGMGPAGAIGRGLLVAPPPFAPRIFSTREVGVEV